LFPAAGFFVRLFLASLLLLPAFALQTGCVPAGTAPIASSAQQQDADAAFADLSRRAVDGIARLSPSYATGLGDHRFDHLITDMSAQGREAANAFNRQILAELDRIDRSRLTRDNQVDAALLENAARYALWMSETLQNWAWDPQIYTDAAGTSLYSLAARDFAPWDVRLKAATARMEALPKLLADTRASLVPERVPPIFATTVAKQNAGIVSIAEDALVPQRGALNAADAARFDAALATLKAAVAEHQVWLDKTLVPRAKGEFRLGPERYDTKLRFALLSPLSRAEIKARALAALAATRAEMYQVAREALAGRRNAPELPDNPTPAQQQVTIEAALELSYASRPTRDTIMAVAESTLKQATDFARKADLVSMPANPIRIIPTPEYQRGVAVAYCDSPGPLDRELATFYMVSPLPDEWSDAQVSSYFREYNNYMMHDLSIHEAMPGHYLQIEHSNRSPSLLRAVLSSGTFIEGWAVYAEGLMADAGYLERNALFRLTVLKMRLRSITNSLLDIGIHTEGMTREQAMELMMKGAFQQESEAAGKWVRANLGSTQLPSYFVGYSEHMELREEARRRQGTSFDLKAYNDEVLSYGSPPVRFVRALMFGEPIG
jgi:uncharacterized protein (DUF885 family)